MADFPYAWLLVLIAAAFVLGVVSSAVRFVNSGGNPSHAVGTMLYGVLAMITGWVAWIALTGPPFP